jgi:hypothetical protein
MTVSALHEGYQLAEGVSKVGQLSEQLFYRPRYPENECAATAISIC